MLEEEKAERSKICLVTKGHKKSKNQQEQIFKGSILCKKHNNNNVSLALSTERSVQFLAR